jgi:hypothetical protein
MQSGSSAVIEHELLYKVIGKCIYRTLLPSFILLHSATTYDHLILFIMLCGMPLSEPKQVPDQASAGACHFSESRICLWGEILSKLVMFYLL